MEMHNASDKRNIIRIRLSKEETEEIVRQKYKNVKQRKEKRNETYKI